MTDNSFTTKNKFLSEDEIERLAVAQERLHARMTPVQRTVVDIASKAVAEEAQKIDNEFEISAARDFASKLCGVRLSLSELDEFSKMCRRVRPGTIFYFKSEAGQSQLLYKTAFGTIDQAARYTQTLEKTVIDITNNSQFTALSFFDLIKLAFKRLFTRSE